MPSLTLRVPTLCHSDSISHWRPPGRRLACASLHWWHWSCPCKRSPSERTPTSGNPTCRQTHITSCPGNGKGNDPKSHQKKGVVVLILCLTHDLYLTASEIHKQCRSRALLLLQSWPSWHAGKAQSFETACQTACSLQSPEAARWDPGLLGYLTTLCDI